MKGVGGGVQAVKEKRNREVKRWRTGRKIQTGQEQREEKRK